MSTELSSKVSSKPIPDGYAKARLLTNQQAAEYIGIQPQTLSVWRCTAREKIPYLKIGRKVLYKIEDLDAWLDSCRMVHTSQAAAGV